MHASAGPRGSAFQPRQRLLSDRGQVAEAEAAWRLALQHRPDFPEALVVLGVALREQGRLTEAEDSLRRALQLRPSFA
ncbi:MAG: tetratricopeptide repeat protein [Candidatus Accumulibacter sp.]|uniref:tetratricopeptide repeat protein n=1 Tax=Accumulibacter sp. TaxID=2053492 RepID=UPI002A5E42B7|nr:tetratricopeptide repeat protein [Accumulibacter sp.]